MQSRKPHPSISETKRWLSVFGAEIGVVVARLWWTDYCYVRNDIVRSASLLHQVLVKRNSAPISVLPPQVATYHPMGKGRGFDRYNILKSITSPLEQVYTRIKCLHHRTVYTPPPIIDQIPLTQGIFIQSNPHLLPVRGNTLIVTCIG